VGLVRDGDCGREGREFLGGCQEKAAAFLGLQALREAAKLHRTAKVAADAIVI
jgi:hypothetical protein